MLMYNPNDWYWIVGGDAARVYSSASGVYVPSDDPAHQKWLSEGGVSTQIDTNDNLGEVLALHRAKPVDPDVLNPYLTTLANTLDGQQVLALLDHEQRIAILELRPGGPKPPDIIIPPISADKVIAALVKIFSRNGK